jgi:hypothetical protein
LLPTLVVDPPVGEPFVVKEVVAFMRALASRGESLAMMRAAAFALGLLHDYVGVAWKDRPITPETLPDVVAGFLRLRRRGADMAEDGLSWSPVKRETVERDRNSLMLFSEFCANRFGHFPLAGDAACRFETAGKGFRDVMRQLERRKGMLLGHHADLHRPAVGKIVDIGEKVVQRRSNGKTFMSKAMIEDLIWSATTSKTRRTSRWSNR